MLRLFETSLLEIIDYDHAEHGYEMKNKNCPSFFFNSFILGLHSLYIKAECKNQIEKHRVAI